MFVYLVVALILGLLTARVWFRSVFPRAEADLLGGAVEALSRRNRVLMALVPAILVFAAAFAVFLRNRGVLTDVDALRVGIKVWGGFLLPMSLMLWGVTKSSSSTFVAVSGYWLLVSMECAILVSWIYLG